MFARLSSVFVLFFIALCVSASAVVPRDLPASQCTTSSLYCCNSLTSASNPALSIIAGLLGVVLGPITGLVGLTCTPLILGGTSCTTQPVCCTGNNYSGVLVLGCVPITIGL